MQPDSRIMLWRSWRFKNRIVGMELFRGSGSAMCRRRGGTFDHSPTLNLAAISPSMGVFWSVRFPCRTPGVVDSLAWCCVRQPNLGIDLEMSLAISPVQS